MKYDVKQCKILRKREIAKGIFDVTVHSPEFAQTAQAGQFAHIYVPGKTLRRPISICEIDRKKKTLRFVYQIRGEGTQILAEQNEGDDLDILAPLGNGFQLGDPSRKAVLIGGGIGVPPLLGVAASCGANATAVLGFRSKDAVILQDDFAALGCAVRIATDDGTAGHHGVVTDCLRDLDFSVIYACGPMPMLKAVCRVARERGVECQISLEERMACGIGACLGCACKLHRDGKEFYGHVCKDGPVFPYQEVCLE